MLVSSGYPIGNNTTGKILHFKGLSMLPIINEMCRWGKNNASNSNA
ncbi:hypothetical protein [Lachnotalea glycerini]|nr:hypothetical protein [Lachnotalea glycerini]